MYYLKLILKILFVSMFFGFLSYILYKLDYSKLDSVWNIVKNGFPETKKVVLGNKYLNKLPMAPVFVFWGSLGGLVYLFYYSLSVVYYEIRNWVIIKLTFIKPKASIKVNFKHYLYRTLIHVSVVLPYLLFILSIVLIGFPIASLIYSKFNGLNNIIVFWQSKLIIKAFLVSLYWFMFFGFYVLLFKVANQVMIEEKLEEEHGFNDI